ncbi:acetate/propionate family kinase [Marinomonas mediterranea]|jgi:acetate kinase (EC 2.7.2.1)|uniref:Acetate kinase n=1 Tax=Marinomonas mediterranea (strain ATCC 700492 / JCM 21426 / NBRC 103028 / MMB-1) TaxID=717774 RepID=F2K3E4_MARM1|nr:acetate kinase [Marinomonas mediterranea]ADZ91286.1 Acetate kinase [Marinomonas mediterranea MMB-1]WCN09257.1 acetate/propionate family kinase [Marinomonas mediterranea]WCN13339.1 acetate/propionate family kinase [Marinomonas mediterranea]WCN17407.1 acetate/propionate family kinase [Marinomonas mediterranea MMB-1]
MNNNVLVINCGSSSLKFAVMSTPDNTVLVEGIGDRLGIDGSTISFKFEGKKETISLSEGSHHEAVTEIKNWLDQRVDIRDAIVGIGHRVVHGGETFSSSAVIDEDVIKGIEDCAHFAPLHNPAHIKGIREAQNLFTGLPQVAVFDTAFHQTLELDQYLYAIPMEMYRNHHFRKYGFHGTSYRFISQELAQLEPESTKQGIIVAHLGNGASTCAIQNGKATDTSMGMTPLDGLMMGTRSGSVDPSLVSFISHAENISGDDAINLLNKKSGLLGISEISSDCRTLEDAAFAGDERATLALDMFASRAAKNLASVATTLDSLDHLVFTGGIGENSNYLRGKICESLRTLNITIDADKNDNAPRGDVSVISEEDANVKVWILPTNEELMIAMDTISLIQQAH